MHHSKDEEKLQRIVQNLEMQKVETIFNTVQAQLSNLRPRDRELCGLSERADWSDGNWRNAHSLVKHVSARFQSKVYVLSDSVLCLGGKTTST